MNKRNKMEYKIQLENILKWGGTKEEQLAAFITLIDDILSEN